MNEVTVHTSLLYASFVPKWGGVGQSDKACSLRERLDRTGVVPARSRSLHSLRERLDRTGVVPAGPRSLHRVVCVS